MASAVATLSSVAVSGIVCSKVNHSNCSSSNALKPYLSSSFPSLSIKESISFRKSSKGKCGSYVTETVFSPAEDNAEVEKVENADVESFDSPLIPNIDEIQSLLNELCDDTSIAEVQIKIKGFKLRVKRDVGKDSRVTPSPSAPSFSAPVMSAPPVPTFPMIDSMSSSPSPVPQTPTYESEEEVDEGLQYISAVSVGIFRSGRPRKGKFGRPFVTEGSKVKIGQLIGFIEQLGTNLNVESEFVGEVSEVFVKEGDPIEFGQKLFSIRPSFPGIKKLQ